MTTTNGGKVEAVKLITGESSTTLDSTNTYMAFGDGTATANPTDTAMGNELGRYQVTNVQRTGQEVKYTYTLNTTQLNGNDIKEIGLFDASSSGNLYSRANIATISKTNAVEIEVEYTIKLV